MNDAGAAIETFRRSDTAELRRRFKLITGLLADGYNHKQICEYLNSEGLAIPYPQYRAIMARLRRENSGASSKVVQAAKAIAPTSIPKTLPAVDVSFPASNAINTDAVPAKKFSWDPESEVKWK